MRHFTYEFEGWPDGRKSGYKWPSTEQVFCTSKDFVNQIKAIELGIFLNIL